MAGRGLRLAPATRSRMRSRRFASSLTVVMALTWSWPSAAQALGSAARRERERRDKLKPKARAAARWSMRTRSRRTRASWPTRRGERARKSQPSGRRTSFGPTDIESSRDDRPAPARGGVLAPPHGASARQRRAAAKAIRPVEQPKPRARGVPRGRTYGRDADRLRCAAPASGGASQGRAGLGRTADRDPGRARPARARPAGLLR